jgi:hypothetical protein
MNRRWICDESSRGAFGRLIHPTSKKRNSTNFAFTEF